MKTYRTCTILYTDYKKYSPNMKLVRF